MSNATPNSPGGAKPSTTGLYFVHIMKTGGTSLGRALLRHTGRDRFYPSLAGDDWPWFKLDGALVEKAAKGNPAEAPLVYSVHLPAWTRRFAPPGFKSLTVIREPVSRTVSHLRHVATRLPDQATVESVFEDDNFRAKLTNYQTRFLVFPEAHEIQMRAQLAADFIAGSASASAEELVASEEGWGLTALSSLHMSYDLSDDCLPRALEVLDSLDIVVTTEDLDRATPAIFEQLGWPLVGATRENTARDSETVAPSILNEIERIVRLDTAVYEQARKRSAAFG